MNPHKRNILIIVIGLVVLCCLFTLVAAGGAGIYTYFKGSATSDSASLARVTPPAVAEAATAPAEPTLPPKPSAAPDVPSQPPAAPDVPTQPPAPNVPPQPSAAPQSGSNHAPLGVSRAEMMKIYKVFVFQKPYTDSGLEMVVGYHTWLCVGKDCAAITLAGSADNLLAVGLEVPTNPKDNQETLTAILLLGDLVSDITKDQSASLQVITDVTDAAKGQKALNKKYNVNGFIVTEYLRSNKDHYVAGVEINK